MRDRQRKKLLLAAVIFLLLLCLMGCQKNVNGVQLFDYQLSAGTSAQDETKKTYAGLIGIPEENNCPVVFIFHGAHSLEGNQPTPYYQGFEYLVKALADSGYVAIAIDTNDAYGEESSEGDEYSFIKKAFQTNYEQLVLANEGKRVLPYNIKGKADLTKINMIGHSRGGDNITRIIADQDFKNISFQSALKIAAAENNELREIYTDIPTALIYPQYDEDVSDLSSANYYYYAYNNDLSRRSSILSAFLYGANHAAFNPLINQSGLVDYGDEVTYLDADLQRTFIQNFAIDFLNVNNNNEKLFAVFNNQTSERYGIDFMLSIHDPYGDRVLIPDEYKQWITVEGLNLEYVVSSKNSLKDTAKAFNLPGTADKVPLYKISWEKAGGNMLMPLDGMFYQLNENKSIALYLALDSSDVKNLSDTPTAFDVVITDAAGKSVTIAYSSEHNAALKYQPGKLIKYDELQEKWQSFTPLGTELIDLGQFADRLTIDNIISLEIIPTSKSGAVMLGGINIYQTGSQ